MKRPIADVRHGLAHLQIEDNGASGPPGSFVLRTDHDWLQVLPATVYSPARAVRFILALG